MGLGFHVVPSVITDLSPNQSPYTGTYLNYNKIVDCVKLFFSLVMNFEHQKYTFF